MRGALRCFVYRVSPVAEEDAKGNTMPMKAFVEKTWVWVALNTLFLLVGIVLFFWGMVDRAGYFNVYWHTRYHFFIGWMISFLVPSIIIGMVVGDILQRVYDGRGMLR